MSEWRLHQGTYTAAENLGIDDFLIEKTAETGQKYLRLYDFENPAVILARNEHTSDLESLKENHDYTRRDTGGSVIYCGENGLFYSIVMPAEENDYPENLHQDYFGPKIAEALNRLGVEEERLGVGEHFSVRINGYTIAGHAQRKKNGAILYHGVLAVEPWDVEKLDELINLRERDGQKEKHFIESLPALREYVNYSGDEIREATKEQIIESFTNGDYTDYRLSGEERKKVMSLVEDRYNDPDWFNSAHGSDSLKNDQGFCFVDWTDEWEEEVREYRFY
ncbi:MAG: biotin/lipoate A/B protein ligase family protein [Candidatus Aenigmatarchaeota archaeon]